MTAIGIKLPNRSETVLHGEIIIRKQDGRYSQTLNLQLPYPTEEPDPVVGELRKFLEKTVKKLNGE